MKGLDLLQLWLVLTVISCCTGARILAVLPFAFKSHHMFFQTVLKELARQGHQVVVYSPFPQEQPVANYTDVLAAIKLTDRYSSYQWILSFFDRPRVAGAIGMWKSFERFQGDALEHENIQKLAKSEEKFDLVIVEAFVGQEVFLAFGHKFNAPTIAIQSIFSYNVVDRAMGNALSLSYIPDFHIGMSNKMTFLERLTNVYSTVRTLFYYYNDYIPMQQALVNQYLKFPNTPPLIDMIHNVSLVLFNYQPRNSYTRPFPPNFIPLGGMHVSTERKPLPKDFQLFMDEAKHGVIYFSLGTVIPENHLPKEYYMKFIKVFEKLKHKVIWKSRIDKIEGLPDNVIHVKWSPQQDILAHPNCALFITHGGLLSQQEVTYAGVPVVAIPFLGDQYFNVRYYEAAGVGVQLDFLSLSEESIFTAINTVLSNPSYKENAVKLSKIARDMPMTQAESAVYWVEYVLRHNGAHHLRPASAHMPWYQLALLDILAFVALVSITTVAAICWLCWKLSQWLSKSRRQTNSRKKQE